MDTAAELDFASLHEGDAFEHAYVIEPVVYEAFLTAFCDRSPLHVDDDYAKERGFERRVMHGSLLNGFVSHFVGMCVPGRRALLLSVDLQYANPSYLGDALTLHATVAQKVDAVRVVVLHVRFHNDTRGTTVAKGRVQLAVAP